MNKLTKLEKKKVEEYAKKNCLRVISLHDDLFILSKMSDYSIMATKKGRRYTSCDISMTQEYTLTEILKKMEKKL